MLLVPYLPPHFVPHFVNHFPPYLFSCYQNLDAVKREKKTSKKATTDSSYPMKNEMATGIVLLVTMFLLSYTFHCTWVTSEAYSSPSIVLSARQQDGSRVIFDDFREAYYWLSQNTPEVWNAVYQLFYLFSVTSLLSIEVRTNFVCTGRFCPS